MTPPFSQHGTITPWRAGPFARLGALLCVLLVLLIGFVSVVHFHAADLNASDHSCTLCALAHTGIASNPISPPAPVFAPSSTLAEVQAGTPYSSLPAFSYCIRPPPAA